MPPQPKGEPGPAPPVPTSFRDAPRIPTSDATARVPASLTVRLSSGGSGACYQTKWEGDSPQAVVLPIPGDRERKVTLLQLAYDPARRTRYLFYDAGASARGAILSASSSGSEGVVSFGFGEMSLSSVEDPACAKFVASAPIGENKPWREGDGPNAGAVLALVEILEESTRPAWGWCLTEGYGGASTNSAVRNPYGGARQEWKLYSYVPRDGESIAVVLEVSVDWADPRDGQVYRYFQFGSGDFVKLDKEGSTAFRLDTGSAVPQPIEIVIFAEDEWAGCASRAALRSAGD